MLILNSTRGLRNRNPGNIRKTNIQWKGKVEGDDQEFETFSDFEFGIRAIGKLLASYDSQGVRTVSAVIHRYAPPVENDSSSYVKSVSRRTGLAEGDTIKPSDRPKVVEAIIHHENGISPFSIEFIERALAIT